MEGYVGALDIDTAVLDGLHPVIGVAGNLYVSARFSFPGNTAAGAEQGQRRRPREFQGFTSSWHELEASP